MKDIDKKWLEKWETVKEKTGKIYSEEYRQRFETKNVIFKIERSPINKNKLMLTINQQPISEWFKEQWEKLQQHLRNSVQKKTKIQRIQDVI